jgi:hypothetical protein
MVKKVKCHCGCRSLVSASTERRHRTGKATPRVKASHAARQTLYAPKRLPQPSKMIYLAGLPTRSSSAPELLSQPPGNGQMHPSNMDVDGGNLNVEMEPASTLDRTFGIAAVDGSASDDTRVSEAVANVREEAWRTQYPVGMEDYVSDNEDNDEGSCGDEDGFNWHAEMFEDDGMCADGGLGVEDMINEDFERELDQFGIAKPCYLIFLTHCIYPFHSQRNYRRRNCLPSPLRA